MSSETEDKVSVQREEEVAAMNEKKKEEEEAVVLEEEEEEEEEQEQEIATRDIQAPTTKDNNDAVVAAAKHDKEEEEPRNLECPFLVPVAITVTEASTTTTTTTTPITPSSSSTFTHLHAWKSTTLRQLVSLLVRQLDSTASASDSLTPHSAHFLLQIKHLSTHSHSHPSQSFSQHSSTVKDAGRVYNFKHDPDHDKTLDACKFNIGDSLHLIVNPSPALTATAATTATTTSAAAAAAAGGPIRTGSRTYNNYDRPVVRDFRRGGGGGVGGGRHSRPYDRNQRSSFTSSSSSRYGGNR